MISRAISHTLSAACHGCSYIEELESMLRHEAKKEAISKGWHIKDGTVGSTWLCPECVRRST